MQSLSVSSLGGSTEDQQSTPCSELSFSPGFIPSSSSCSTLLSLNSSVDVPVRTLSFFDQLASSLDVRTLLPVIPSICSTSVSPPEAHTHVKAYLSRLESYPTFQLSKTFYMPEKADPVPVQPDVKHLEAFRVLQNLGQFNKQYERNQEMTGKDFDVSLDIINQIVPEENRREKIQGDEELFVSAQNLKQQQQTDPQQPMEGPFNLDCIILSQKYSQGGPLLCSICKQKSPVLGTLPRKFSYVELEDATNGFSKDNFLAEGEFGLVYRGLLSGQAIAVKQQKLASTQGYSEFWSEIEVLSHAQHRNLVMLLGCCDEIGHRMLVYEYVCNKSLDWHLSSNCPTSLEWASRHKIAIGTAKALRYLHGESRIGCIVHRDMRPSKILLTHEFEPMVGDFGLARSHDEGEDAIQTRIIGAFGYLAPEYIERGQISWKSDVYAFGVVLLELVTGRKALDVSRPPEQKSLTEWARPRLLNEDMLTELVDPRLKKSYSLIQMRCMMHAAYHCIKKDPSARPRMREVLHILEGETPRQLLDCCPSVRQEKGAVSSRGRRTRKTKNLSYESML